MKKRCIILRGLPGSGKTTWAKEFVKTHRLTAYHSTDTYFMVNGEYLFDPTRLLEYHHANYLAFVRTLRLGTQCVIVDNCQPRIRDMYRYVRSAEIFDYAVEVVELSISVEEAVQRNIHKVPRGPIEWMHKIWEPYQYHPTPYPRIYAAA